MRYRRLGKSRPVIPRSRRSAKVSFSSKVLELRAGFHLCIRGDGIGGVLRGLTA